MDLTTTLNKSRREIMGIAAIMIVIFHVWLPVIFDLPVLPELEAIWKRLGNMGVSIFFLYSGMGLYKSLCHNTVGVFYYHRIRRIVLPFLVTGIISAFAYKWTFIHFIKAVTGFLFFTGDIHGLLWFVQAISVCYLLYPLYHKLISKTAYPVKVTVLISMIFILISAVFRALGSEDYDIVFQRIPVFLLGILISRTGSERKILVGRKHLLLMLPAMAFGIFAATKLSQVLFFYHCFFELFAAVPLCIYLSILSDKLTDGFFLKKALAFTGKMSFEIYCVHTLLFNQAILPLINTYGKRFFTQPPNLLINTLVIALTIPIAFILYKLNQVVFSLIDKKTKKD